TSERVVRLVERLLEGDRAEYHKIAAFSASRRDERSEQGRQHGQAQYRQASSAKDGSNHAGSGAGDTTRWRRAWSAMVVAESQISSNLHHRKCSVLTWKLEAYMSCRVDAASSRLNPAAKQGRTIGARQTGSHGAQSSITSSGAARQKQLSDSLRLRSSCISMNQSVCHNVRGVIMSKETSRREFVQAAGTAAALVAAAAPT